MDLNTTIDIGKNMTDLLEKLAMKIGTTAETTDTTHTH